MRYTTGAGQKLVVHKKDVCNGYCTVHNPSMGWPTLWRDDWGFMEYTCPCGVGFVAPEDEGGSGHAFGVCGNPECMREYKDACDRVAEAGQ